MNLCMKQKQTHRHKEQTCGCQGERAGEGMEWEFWGQQIQTIIHSQNKQQGHTYCSTENYIQYPVINRHGKEYKKECIFTYN